MKSFNPLYTSPDTGEAPQMNPRGSEQREAEKDQYDTQHGALPPSSSDEEEENESLVPSESERDAPDESHWNRYLDAAIAAHDGTGGMAAVGLTGGVVGPHNAYTGEDPWIQESRGSRPDTWQQRREEREIAAEARRSAQLASSPFSTPDEQCKPTERRSIAKERDESGHHVVGVDPGSPAPRNVGDDKNFSSDLVKQQYIQLLAQLPKQDQLELQFLNVCSWAVMGDNSYVGRVENFLGQFSPMRPYNFATKHAMKAARGAKNNLRPSSVISTVRRRSIGGKPSPEARMEEGKGILQPPGGVTKPKSKFKLFPVSPRVLLPMSKKQGPPEGVPGKQILHNISGKVSPGRVLALMGPSGSGKTSLLAVIGGRTPPRIELSGQLLANGNRFNKVTRKRIGFVLQDDVLYETLTVFETLMYAGRLRLPRDMTRQEKASRVEAVLSVLGILKSKDTIIGGFFRRGISGGERKRVSVGHELLINPSILLLDEPTSGLDSTTALHLVNLLRDLASAGRAVLTTIHQPSSRLYRQLDQVMLLSEGHVMYYGDGLRADDWFKHLGFGLPYGTNLADHILDCATGQVAYNPEAPGAAAAKATEGPACAAPYIHGPVAVRCLYSTFENWYLQHPDGFTLDGTNQSGELLDNKTTQQLQGLLKGLHLSLAEGDSIPGISASEQQAAARKSLAEPKDIGSTSSSTASSSADGAKDGLSSPGSPSDADSAGKDEKKGAHAAVALQMRQQGRVDSVVGRDGNGEEVASGPQGWLQRAFGKDENQRMAEKMGAPYLEQVYVLWKRAVKVRRFESFSGQQLFQLVAVAIIAGLLWWQRGRGDDLAAATDIMGLLFFELLFPAFRSLFSALFTFPSEFRILSKERPSGMYSLSAYYWARIGADLPIEMALPTIFIVIVYWFGYLRPTGGAFLANWATLLLVVTVSQSWGLLIGGISMDPKTAQTTTTVIMLTFLLVGGFYVRDVPVWIGWIKYFSFIYWGNNLLMKIEFGGRSIKNCDAPRPEGAPCPEVDNVQEALNLMVDPNSRRWEEVIILLAMLIILRFLTYIVLRWKTNTSSKSL